MGFLIFFLLLFVIVMWILIKSVKTMLLLARYNNRNGLKAGMYSEKAKTPKQFFKLLANAKQWDAEQKAIYKGERYRNF